MYTIRLQGLKWSGTTLISSTSLVIDANYGELELQVDNSPPVSEIKKIKHNVVNVAVCEILDFSTETLAIEIEASDARGHLRKYVLNAMYGHNSIMSPRPADAEDNYSNHIGPGRTWGGGNFTVNYDGTTYDSTKIPKCVYQFRLNVTKRTSNLNSSHDFINNKL